MGFLTDVRDPNGTGLLLSEAERHSALRRAVSPWFTPKRVEDLRKPTRDLAVRVVEEIARDGGAEVMSTLAFVVPSIGFSWMVGASETDAAAIARWSPKLLEVFTASPEAAPAIMAVAGEVAQFAEDLVAAKRNAPGDDLTTHLLNAASAGVVSQAGSAKRPR